MPEMRRIPEPNPDGLTGVQWTDDEYGNFYVNDINVGRVEFAYLRDGMWTVEFSVFDDIWEVKVADTAELRKIALDEMRKLLEGLLEVVRREQG